MTNPGGPTDPYQQPYGQPQPDPYAQPPQPPYGASAQPPYGSPPPPYGSPPPPYGPPQPVYGQPQPPAVDPYAQQYQQPAYGQPPYPQPQYQQPPWATQLPAPAGQQRGGKLALIGIAGLLVVIVVLVGGYFAYQKVFVTTPSEAVQAYIDEARKAQPDKDKIAGMLCKAEADKWKKEADTGTDNQNASRIIDWTVTGETITGDTAVVYTSFTIKASTSSSKTTNGQLTIDLVKENRDWKICDFEA